MGLKFKTKPNPTSRMDVSSFIDCDWRRDREFSRVVVPRKSDIFGAKRLRRGKSFCAIALADLKNSLLIPNAIKIPFLASTIAS